MKKLFLFFIMTVFVCVVAKAEQVSFGSQGSWYEIDGTTATIHVAKDHDLGSGNAAVYDALATAGVTKIVFDSTSKMSSTDVSSSQVNKVTTLETLDLSGVSLEGGRESYYFGSYEHVKQLILQGVTADKKIEIKNNSKLEVAVVTPATSTNVEFTANNSDLGVIKNDNCNTTSTFKWTGDYSTFDTYDAKPTVYDDSFPQSGKTALVITGSMSPDDVSNLEVLSSVSGEIRLLNMTGVNLSDAENTVFPFKNNNHLVSVALPYGLEDAKAEWFEGCSNLYAAFTYDSDFTSIKAYVGTPGRLKNAFVDLHKSNDSRNDNTTKIYSSVGGDIQYLSVSIPSTLKKIKLSGTLNAMDVANRSDKINSSGNLGYTSESKEEKVDSRGMEGALVGCAFEEWNREYEELDLSDAYFPVTTDLTISQYGMAYANLKKIILPTDPRQTTLPAFMFNASFPKLLELCIPSNYTTIKSMAFGKTTQGFLHIWTTDPNPNTKVDNGVVTAATDYIATETVYGYDATDAGYDSDSHMPLWGTYTFSSNLKLIESYAFSMPDVSISDVYVLATEAPECHVDAFNMSMYVGQSGFGGAVQGGIVTREVYRNGKTWLTMLHYPRDCDAPDIQHYTDMGREYSIATGMVDGKGANIYFPTYSEFLRAYLQGTYGYLWNSLDDTRAYGELVYNPYNDNQGWSAGTQKDINDFVTKHPGTYTDGTKAFSDAIFYDVTLGGNTKPDGMKDYWEVTYGGTPLYPKPEVVDIQYNYIAWDGKSKKYKLVDGNYVETTESEEGVSYYMREQEQAQINGYPAYDECDEGTFVQNYTYVQDNNGKYARTAHDAGTYSETTTSKNGVTEYYNADKNQITPKIKDWTYYTGTEKAVLTAIDFNNSPFTPEFLNEHYPYYNENGTESKDVKFWDTKFYKDADGNWQSTTVFLPNTQLYTEQDDSKIWPASGKTWYTDINTQDSYYYQNGSTTEYSYASGEYDSSVTYYTDNSGTVASTVEFDGTYYIKDVTYTYSAATGDTEAADRYSRSYIANSYRAAENGDDVGGITETRYCPVMVDKIVSMNVLKQNDYRGWHQFVLTGFAANTTHTVTQHRSYLTDKDWWTICLPYNLTYKDMIFFYGGAGDDGVIGTDDDDIPYLSQLVNVVRDMKATTVTLNFSKNLMNHSAEKNESTGVWTIGDDEDKTIETQNKVVLYAGVPYLIRPNIAAENPIRQFDIYGGEETEVDNKFSDGRLALVDKDLYERLKAAESMSGEAQRELMEKGLVTVPGLVANKGADARATEEVKSDPVSNNEEYTYTYKLNGTTNVYTYPVSAEWDYTFVGSLYKSFIPEYSYYLGWDGQATFFFADEPKTIQGYAKKEDGTDDESKPLYQLIYNDMQWNNNTSLIVPNMLASGATSNPYNLGKGTHTGKVTQASGEGASMKPAQWVISGQCDHMNENSAGAKKYIMEFGISVSKETTGIKEVSKETDARLAGKLFNMNGVEVGTSTRNLPKGVYIQNGKKVVVK